MGKGFDKININEASKGLVTAGVSTDDPIAIIDKDGRKCLDASAKAQMLLGDGKVEEWNRWVADQREKNGGDVVIQIKKLKLDYLYDLCKDEINFSNCELSGLRITNSVMNINFAGAKLISDPAASTHIAGNYFNSINLSNIKFEGNGNLYIANNGYIKIATQTMTEADFNNYPKVLQDDLCHAVVKYQLSAAKDCCYGGDDKAIVEKLEAKKSEIYKHIEQSHYTKLQKSFHKVFDDYGTDMKYDWQHYGTATRHYIQAGADFGKKPGFNMDFMGQTAGNIAARVEGHVFYNGEHSFTYLGLGPAYKNRNFSAGITAGGAGGFAYGHSFAGIGASAGAGYQLNGIAGIDGRFAMLGFNALEGSKKAIYEAHLGFNFKLLNTMDTQPKEAMVLGLGARIFSETEGIKYDLDATIRYSIFEKESLKHKNQSYQPHKL